MVWFLLFGFIFHSIFVCMYIITLRFHDVLHNQKLWLSFSRDFTLCNIAWIFQLLCQKYAKYLSKSLITCKIFHLKTRLSPFMTRRCKIAQLFFESTFFSQLEHRWAPNFIKKLWKNDCILGLLDKEVKLFWCIFLKTTNSQQGNSTNIWLTFSCKLKK